MDIRTTAIPDVVIVVPNLYKDDRGFLMETYQQARYLKAGIGPFVQENHSGSRQGTLRGLHYQIRHAQGKLIRVLNGEIFDVAVDLRMNSRTFRQWVAETLSSEGREQMWIPPGFAHGFYVLSAYAEVEYKLTDYYTPEWQRTIKWDDSDLGVAWPLVDQQPPHLSARDQAGTAFDDAEVYASMWMTNS